MIATTNRTSTSRGACAASLRKYVGAALSRHPAALANVRACLAATLLARPFQRQPPLAGGRFGVLRRRRVVVVVVVDCSGDGVAVARRERRISTRGRRAMGARGRERFKRAARRPRRSRLTPPPPRGGAAAAAAAARDPRAISAATRSSPRARRRSCRRRPTPSTASSPRCSAHCSPGAAATAATTTPRSRARSRGTRSPSSAARRCWTVTSTRSSWRLKLSGSNARDAGSGVAEATTTLAHAVFGVPTRGGGPSLAGRVPPPRAVGRVRPTRRRGARRFRARGMLSLAGGWLVAALGEAADDPRRVRIRRRAETVVRRAGRRPRRGLGQRKERRRRAVSRLVRRRRGGARV